MKQFGIFLLGALRMLVIMALIITCINAIAEGPNFIKVMGVISIVVVVYECYLIIRDTRNN